MTSSLSTAPSLLQSAANLPRAVNTEILSGSCLSARIYSLRADISSLSITPSPFTSPFSGIVSGCGTGAISLSEIKAYESPKKISAELSFICFTFTTAFWGIVQRTSPFPQSVTSAVSLMTVYSSVKEYQKYLQRQSVKLQLK